MNNTTVPLASDLIFDVGMHRGEDTEYYLKRGFRVVAFEANPDLVKENIITFSSEISSGSLVIVEGAIVDDPTLGSVKFYVNENSSVWGTINPGFAERNEQLGTRNRVVEVTAIDFRSCLAQYGIPYFMKIDIEGADLFCLQALKDFTEKPSYISIESNKTDFDRVLDEITLIEGLGYEHFQAVQQADVPKMKVPIDSREGIYAGHIFSKEASGMFGSDLPGMWLNKEEAVQAYKDIFELYQRFGDETFWQKNQLAQTFLKALSRLTGKHYPGWHDLHARHKSVTSHSNAGE